MRYHRAHRGSLLIEAIASIAIFAVLLAAAFGYASDRANDLKDQSAAQYQSQVVAAAKKYILDNYNAVLSASTPATPAVITAAMLRSTGYLPDSFQSSNSYAQTPCVLALQPSSNQIHALVVTEGGSAIPSKRTPVVAAMMGAMGGYIPSDSPTSARGAFGGWQLVTAPFVSQNCSGTAAAADHLAAAVFFDAGNVAPDYVYRGAVPGHPEFNAMTTPLSMKAVVTGGTSDGLCVVGNTATYGRIAVDSNGAVMSCQLGVWQKQSGYWKDPVANFAALPASNNTQGDVRLTTDYDRAYSWTGSAWIPLAVDQNGNLTVPGTITFNQAQVNRVVIAGTACASTGLLARDSAGSLLTCQSGSWAKGAVTGSLTPMYLETWAPQTPVPCPATWTDLGYQEIWSGDKVNVRRTCLPPSATCSVLYLATYSPQVPTACPAAWTNADPADDRSHRELWSNNQVNQQRACYKC